MSIQTVPSSTLPGIIQSDEIRGFAPIDLKPRPVVAVTSPAEIAETTKRARTAQPAWEALGFDGRVKVLKAATRAMLERRKESCALLLEEGGKFSEEAMFTEALGPMDYLKNWIPVVRTHLKPRKLPIPMMAYPGKSATTDLVPRGVVGIIAPWNYPLGTYFKPVFPALLAGNTVVMKPSEFAPRTGEWFKSVLAEFLPKDVIQTVHGGGPVGQALVQSGIDALVFTGSVPTGKRVLQLAAEQMIPCSVELCGKDPAIVLADCNLPRTVAGILNWGLHNSGQDCGSVERVYVVDAIADRFVPMLASAASRLVAASQHAADRAVDVGPLNNRRQLQIVEEHVADALLRGAKLLTGGKPTGEGLFFQPTILDGCDHTMKVINEETFGPVIPIVRVKDVEEAIRLANDSIYGLNASVWTEDLAGGDRIARRLQAGTVFINNHALTGAMAFAPWTGVKQSGYGVANSQFAMATYTRPRTILTDKSKAPDPWWLPLDSVMGDIAERLALAQLGQVTAAIKVPGLFKKRVRTILDFVQPPKKS